MFVSLFIYDCFDREIVIIRHRVKKRPDAERHGEIDSKYLDVYLAFH